MQDLSHHPLEDNLHNRWYRDWALNQESRVRSCITFNAASDTTARSCCGMSLSNLCATLATGWQPTLQITVSLRTDYRSATMMLVCCQIHNARQTFRVPCTIKHKTKWDSCLKDRSKAKSKTKSGSWWQISWSVNIQVNLRSTLRLEHTSPKSKVLETNPWLTASSKKNTNRSGTSTIGRGIQQLARKSPTSTWTDSTFWKPNRFN